MFSRPRRNLVYETSRIELSNEANVSSWATIRDKVQGHEPFAVINFKSTQTYDDFLQDIAKFDSYTYIKQTLHTSTSTLDKKDAIPSLFVYQEKHNDSFFNTMRECIHHYKLESIILGFEDNSTISILYSNGKYDSVGNNVISSLSNTDVSNGDYFQTGSIYYTFDQIYAK